MRAISQDPGAARILLSPIGVFSAEILDPVARLVREVFGFGTRVASLVRDIGFALDVGRNQYHSTPILHRLAFDAPSGVLKVAALCHEDLFIPILTYVYGEAQLEGRACIVSTHRLSDSLAGPGPDAHLVSRLAKEVVHELGHTFGLRHCPDPACLMHYCREASDVDRKTDQLCRYCKVFLADALEK